MQLTGVELETSPRIRVLLEDAHSLFRQALKASLQEDGDIDVVAEASDDVDAVSEAERVRPDVIFLDANLPGADPIRTIAQLRERIPESRVVIVVDHDDPVLLAEAVEEGARGYVSKGSALADLIDTTHSVYRGETAIPRHMIGDLLATLLERRRKYQEANRKVASLTRREREVLSLLADGADSETIAHTLVISPETARTHLQNILQKLGVHSRLEAAAFVIQQGVRDDLVSS